MGPNAKFYGRYLWKPPNSELHNPVCRECEEKRSACFTVSAKKSFIHVLYKLCNEKGNERKIIPNNTYAFSVLHGYLWSMRCCLVR